MKVDLELPTNWHVPILCIIFPLENPHRREKRYVEYSNVLLNLFSQCNLWRNITFNDNRFFILRNTPVLQLEIFLHNRYALLLRMETLATVKVEIVSEELKVCKRDKQFEGWVFSIAFVPIVFIDDNALCMVLNYVHCPALLLPCLSVCYRNEMDLDQVPSLWWWITCAVESYVANLGELINIHLIALSSKRLHKLKAVFRYTIAVSNTSRSLLYVVELSYFISDITWNLTLYILTEETVYCFCENKPVHDCFELCYRLELDFLGLSERYVMICFYFFM